jgi:2-oxoglutarate dehydrogenase E1 component
VILVLHNQYCIKLLQNIKPRDLYADKLMADGIIDATYVKFEKEYKADLEMNLEAFARKT